MRSLQAQRPDLQGKLGFRRDQMRLAVPDWEVTEAAWRAFAQPQLTLPDPDDVHVLAAALAGQVDYIVTANLKDFPDKVLRQYGLEAIHPDAFITELWETDAIASIAAFKRMRARWRNPKATPEDFAQAMERGGLWRLAERLRNAAELI